MILIFAMLADAAAQSCPEAYSVDDLLRDTQSAQTALRDGDLETLALSSTNMQAGLPCFNEEVLPRVFANTYRLIGANQVLVGSADAGRMWFRSALELEPTFSWDASSLPADSAVAQIFAGELTAAGADPEGIPGKELDLAEGARLLLDGQELVEPVFRRDRYHVLQLVDTDGQIRSVWVLKGDSFPERLLRDPVVVAEEEVEEEVQETKINKKAIDNPYGYDAADVVSAQRDRPPEKIPLLVGGGLVTLGGGAAYALSMASRAEFDGATTEAELYDTRDRTNALFLLGAGLGVVGLGTTTFGVLAADGPGLQVGWSW